VAKTKRLSLGDKQRAFREECSDPALDCAAVAAGGTAGAGAGAGVRDGRVHRRDASHNDTMTGMTV